MLDNEHLPDILLRYAASEVVYLQRWMSFICRFRSSTPTEPEMSIRRAEIWLLAEPQVPACRAGCSLPAEPEVSTCKTKRSLPA